METSSWVIRDCFRQFVPPKKTQKSHFAATASIATAQGMLRSGEKSKTVDVMRCEYIYAVKTFAA